MKPWTMVLASQRMLALCSAILCLLIVALYVCSIPIQSAVLKVTGRLESSSSSGSILRENGEHRELKVFMYDLPRKFNFGLFNRAGPHQELPWTDVDRIPLPHKNGLRRQHSVEYWLTLSLIAGEGRSFGEDDASSGGRGMSTNRVAVRVADPHDADVFFVPFFAALSFNLYGVSMRDPETEHDRNLQVELVDFLEKSPWWQRSGGRDHVLVLHHPNSFRFLKNRLNASLLVVADFARFPQSVARLSKDVVAPYSHMVPTFVDDDVARPFEQRSTLLFFQGRIKRKDDGVVRTELASVLGDSPRVHFEEALPTNSTVQQAMEGMRSSRFCLHPAGDTPSSCRLFDAIVSHCVPVVVSDKIELPFEDELDYSEFCLFVSTRDAVKPGYLISVLERFPKRRWLRMWRRLKQVSKHFEYQHPAKEDDAVSMLWKQIRRKVPAIKLAMHRSRRLKLKDWWSCKR